jgi:hypothetical protein
MTVGAETVGGTMLPPKDVNILCTHMHLPSLGKTLNPGDSSHLASNPITPVQLPKWGSLLIHGRQANDSFMTLQQNQLIIQQYGSKTKLQ